MNAASKIAPSILSAHLPSLAMSLPDIYSSGIRWLHFDIMDSHFVPTLTFGPILVGQYQALWTGKIDCHLMVSHPENLLDAFIKLKADNITLHVESKNLSRSLFEKIKNAGLMAGISLCPPTPVEEIYPFLDIVDWVLVMTVHPGASGQTLIPECAQRIYDLSTYRLDRNLDFKIEADGGINLRNVNKLLDNGLDRAVMGHGYFQEGLTPHEFAQKITSMRNNACPAQPSPQ